MRSSIFIVATSLVLPVPPKASTANGVIGIERRGGPFRAEITSTSNTHDAWPICGVRRDHLAEKFVAVARLGVHDVSMTQASYAEPVARTGGAHLRAQDSRRRSTSDRQSHLPVRRDTRRKWTDIGTACRKSPGQPRTPNCCAPPRSWARPARPPGPARAVRWRHDVRAGHGPPGCSGGWGRRTRPPCPPPGPPPIVDTRPPAG